jgi:Uma2 family endonuclease
VIAQDRLAIDVFTRQPDGRWLLDAYTDPEAAIPCESIGCTLTLGEVYAKVEFEAAPGRSGHEAPAS